jgi:ATP-dependent protease ClpP protease subunit
MNSRFSKPKHEVAPVRVPKSTGTLTGVLHSRRVPLRGPITERTAACCINRMLILAADNKKEPIIIDVESNGGSVKDALAIIRTMNGIVCPVATFCRGRITGAGIMIAAHGVKGFRVAHPDAQFALPAGFPAEAVERRNGDESGLVHTLIQMLTTDTGRAETETWEWLRAGRFWTTPEAMSSGIVDVNGLKPLFPGYV